MLAELEFLFVKKGDAERERGEPECEWTASDARLEVVEGGTGEPDGVGMEVMDVSVNRGGGSSGSSSTTGSCSASGRISASTGGNSWWSSLMGDSSNGSRAPGIASETLN
ncbi:hypothetical protein BDM02DRAFT_1002443 [Thelephora ganbajun]|uniref:Uncharacterized protein n=1 Tax=Thelephora ganbajun TaxID=370292 RepID=A0ACB6ZMQ2_THEGA|nr:hypothetical protein BDM02DRAFT_1002443 [Thelephora ganbajun]